MQDFSSLLERAPRLRKAAFIALLAWMLAAPVGRQVFGLETPWLHPWTMFQEVGAGLYDIQFFDGSSGELQPLDWPPPLRAPHTIRHVLPPPARAVRSANELRWVIQQVCSSAPRPEVLRARIRRATRYLWETKVDVDTPLCVEGLDVD